MTPPRGADRHSHVALLRGVNVGRGNPLAMAEVRAAITAEGFGSVATIGRSGNLLVAARGAEEQAIVDRIQTALRERFGKRIAVVVRSAAELATVIAANPIPEAVNDGRGLHVAFLASPISTAERARIEAIDAGPDTIRLRGREIYVWYRLGMSGSATAEQLGRALTTTATDRNWNTVLKLADAVQQAVPGSPG